MGYISTEMDDHFGTLLMSHASRLKPLLVLLVSHIVQQFYLNLHNDINYMHI